MTHKCKLGVMLLGLGLLPGVVLGATYSWIGQGDNNVWSTCPRNWVVVGLGGCYPNDYGDDAGIPYNAIGWVITLIYLDQIDDFTIDSDVDFDYDNDGTHAIGTLVTNTVVIAATNGESIVTVSSDSGITAED
ncbi:MAG: hypothetical protein CHACPFDD_01728 [Phycisphaerae bacterium]|nr:hypothetical protein [Phycisphaerae bacterium]